MNIETIGNSNDIDSLKFSLESTITQSLDTTPHNPPFSDNILIWGRAGPSPPPPENRIPDYIWRVFALTHILILIAGCPYATYCSDDMLIHEYE